tara:strand:+ start:782 stop:988 length:207 start_codon:yes stop_codon:yes gene_type:complete
MPAELILNILAKIKPSVVFKRKSGTLTNATRHEIENSTFLEKTCIRKPAERIIGIHTIEEIKNEIDIP